MDVEFVEIKSEPLDDMVIKDELLDESYPEFVVVPEEILCTGIKHEQEEAAAEDYPLNLVQFQPAHSRTNSANINNQNNNIHQSDLSIFWKPYQRPVKSSSRRKNEALLNKVFHFGKNLLRTICSGYSSLILPAGWNMFFVDETNEFSLLIAQMSVEDGLPTMQRQIIINSALQVSFFFGTRKIHNIALCTNAIENEQCIQSVIEEFSALNWCRGLSPVVRIERWASLIMLDSIQNNHTFRHRRCKLVHGSTYDQCSDCKYLELRDRKQLLVKKKSYITFDMLDIRTMMNRIRRLKRSRTVLIKTIQRLKRKPCTCSRRNLKNVQ